MSLSGCSELSQEFAQRLCAEGATVVLLNVPPGTEIGIDLYCWNVAHKFKGIKMIPPGLHFIYYSAVNKQGQTAPRTGFFYNFEPKDVLVKVYQPATEDFILESEDQTERVRLNLCNLDPELGTYPLDTWRRWVSLSQHITKEQLDSVLPLTGMVCSVPEMVAKDIPGFSITANSDARKRQKQEQQQQQQHATDIKHTDADDSSCSSANQGDIPADVQMKEKDDSSQAPSGSDNKLPSGSGNQSPSCSGKEPPVLPVTVASEKSTCSVDQACSSAHQGDSTPSCSSSADSNKRPLPSGLPDLVAVPGTEFRWYHLPNRPFKSGATPAEVTMAGMDSTYLLQCLLSSLKSPSLLLGELQLSFLVFLAGQSWVGWERWRLLLSVVCRAEQGLLQHAELYAGVIAVLHYQINEVPEDLFVDIVEQQNFLAASLSYLFANISDNTAALPRSLVGRAARFRSHLTAKYGWCFDADGDEEDEPVVVDLEEGGA